jgi:hypothetical protein
MTAAPSEPGSHDLPSLGTIQAALRKTTEVLARELAQPGDAAPDWSPSEWLFARAVATLQGISPLLSRSIRWEGAPGWNQFLREQRIHTEARYQHIQDLLALLDSTARRAGIALVALKGAALHSLGVYSAGERPMADVDLLVREADAERTAEVLESLGFQETLRTPRHRIFQPCQRQDPGHFGENAANAMKIEMHTHIGEQLPVRRVDVSARIYPRDPHPGLNDYPDRAALMTHLLLHAAGAMAVRSARLLHLNDISRLAARLTDQDWNDVLSPEADNQPAWWAYPPLALTARYYCSVPAQVLATARNHCPLLLRRISEHQKLSDVSLSYMWVSALPGIEWARSPWEMAAYLRQRVAPSRSLKTLRVVVGNTEPIARAPWNRMSQRQRIVRWLTSRPARPETLYTVRAALAQTR